MESTVNEAIRRGLEERKMTQQKLAEKIGVKTAQEIQSLLRAKNGIRSDNLIKIMNAMGYDVVIKDRLNDNEVVLTLQNQGETK